MRHVYRPRKNTPYAAPSWAAECLLGHTQLKAVLLLLAGYADERYSCYPGQETIAEQTEISERTVRRLLDWLEYFGAFTRVKRYNSEGKRTSDRFFLNVDYVLDVYHDAEGNETEKLPLDLKVIKEMGVSPIPMVDAPGERPTKGRKGQSRVTSPESGAPAPEAPGVTEALPANLSGSDSEDVTTGHLATGSERATGQQVTGSTTGHSDATTGQIQATTGHLSGRVTPSRTPSKGTPSPDGPATGTPGSAPDGPRKRGTRLPEDWEVTPELVAWFRGSRCKLVDGQAQTEMFKNYWWAKAGKDAVKLDWDLTWKNWMLREQTRLEQLADRIQGKQAGGRLANIWDVPSPDGGPQDDPIAEDLVDDPSVWFADDQETGDDHGRDMA